MGVTFNDENWWCLDHRNDITDDVCANLGLDLFLKNMQLQGIKKILVQANRRRPVKIKNTRKE